MEILPAEVSRVVPDMPDGMIDALTVTQYNG